MSFFAFRLDTLTVVHRRGILTDTDIVTFGIRVNQADRGYGSGIFPALANGSVTPAAAIQPGVRQGMGRDWIIGPFEFERDDAVEVIYTATNTSDRQLSDIDAERAQLKIMDLILTTAVGAIGGPVGAAIGAALGAVTDPVARLLGWEPQGPCNGLILADAVAFTGGGLGQLPFAPPTVSNSFNTLPNAQETSITRSYNDTATHDSNVCGGIAEYQVTFSVLEVAPPLSTAFYAGRRSPSGGSFKSFASLRPGGDSVGIKTLLGIRS